MKEGNFKKCKGCEARDKIIERLSRRIDELEGRKKEKLCIVNAEI